MRRGKVLYIGGGWPARILRSTGNSPPFLSLKMPCASNASQAAADTVRPVFTPLADTRPVKVSLPITTVTVPSTLLMSRTASPSADTLSSGRR